MVKADVIGGDRHAGALQLIENACVHFLQVLERALPLRVTRLIRDDEEQPSSAGGLLKRFRGAVAHLQVAHVSRRFPFAVRWVEHELVENAVAIEKQGAIHRPWFVSASRIAMLRTIVVSCSSTRRNRM